MISESSVNAAKRQSSQRPEAVFNEEILLWYRRYILFRQLMRATSYSPRSRPVFPSFVPCPTRNVQLADLPLGVCRDETGNESGNSSRLGMHMSNVHEGNGLFRPCPGDVCGGRYET